MTCELLLTGAQGQLGWEVARRAGDARLSLRAFTRAELDISSGAQVDAAITAAKPKVVINAGAYTAVDRAEGDRDAAFAANRDGPANLAAACGRHGATLIHISTDYVYDGAKREPYVETDPTGPLGVYGASKLAGEEAVRAALPRHVILRTAWVFGVHGNNFVKTMLRLAKERPSLRVVDDQRGCPTFAGDLADAALKIARRIIDGPEAPALFGTFHCVADGAVTWCGFARAIVGGAVPVEAITTADYLTPARRPANSVLNCDRLERVYGLRLCPWPQGLAEMLARL
jgi:dTDP-4-dehydrorhamnose reductase